MASLRPSAHCPRCGIKLISPEWSEAVSEEKAVNLWCCPICGEEFETTDNVAEEPSAISELTEEFFSTLLVA